MRIFALWVAAAVIAVSPAFAWSDGGHQVSGVIAARVLDAASRDKVVALLREHPYYTQDFAAKPADADEVEWLFARAAIWSDIARDYEGQDHPTWHYINVPLKLPGTDTIEWTQNVQREWTPQMDAGNLNIVQALAKAEADVANVALPAADRAVALCWLFHLVGDLHQPCHAVALVTATRFPEGDRGGNLIPIKGEDNLHAYWDGLLGSGEKWDKVTNRAKELMTLDDFRIAAERAHKELNTEQWLQESIGVAREYAYTIGLREHVLRHEASATLPPKKLNYQYRFQSRDAAYTRVAQAGYRLAGVLAELAK